MAHKAEIIEVVQLTDGALSYLLRCCGYSKTDSWHTIYPVVSQARSVPVSDENPKGIIYELVARPESEFDIEIEGHLKSKELQHEAMQRAEAVLEKFKAKQLAKAG